MPELSAYEQQLIVAFRFMSRGRPVAMSIGFIPPIEYYNYCQFFGVDDPDALIRVVSAADSRFVQLMREKSNVKHSDRKDQ